MLVIINVMLIFPAPGSYDVEKADKKVHESSPAYSLGIKHKERRPEDIPGLFLFHIKKQTLRNIITYIIVLLILIF